MIFTRNHAKVARRVMLLTVALGWVTSSLGAQGVDGAKPKTEYAQEYAVSFRGKPEQERPFQLAGPEAEQRIQYEPDGLRITMPPGHMGERNVAVRTGIAVQGDFEITVTFEMLQEPTVADAGKSGTKLHLMLQFEKELAGLTRQVAPWGKGTQWTAWFNPWQQKQKYQPFPATANRARLRLIRSGGTLSYAVAEEGEDFKALQEYPCRTDDVTDVRLTASTGGVNAALDARVTDLHLRADALPNLPTAIRQRVAWRLWLGLGILVAVALGLLVVGRLRRRPAAPAAEEAIPSQEES